MRNKFREAASAVVPVLIQSQPVPRYGSAPCVGAEELKPDDSGSEQQKTLAAISSRFSNKEVRRPLPHTSAGHDTAPCCREVAR